jgi:hypothetical protein
MKETLTKFDFMDGMQKYASSSFSYEGLEILWDYLSELEEDSGQEFEFDPVAFRCDFSESSVDDILSENRVEFEENLSDKEKLYLALDYLNKNTTIIGMTDKVNILYQNF